jgi:hypothetical protein
VRGTSASNISAAYLPNRYVHGFCNGG